MVDQRNVGQPRPSAEGGSGYRSIDPPAASAMRRLGQALLPVALVVGFVIWMLIFVSIFGDIGGPLGVVLYVLLLFTVHKLRQIHRLTRPLAAVNHDAEMLAQARALQRIDPFSERASPSTALRWTERATLGA